MQRNTKDKKTENKKQVNKHLNWGKSTIKTKNKQI